jgi:hypothetical protein
VKNIMMELIHSDAEASLVKGQTLFAQVGSGETGRLSDWLQQKGGPTRREYPYLIESRYLREWAVARAERVPQYVPINLEERLQRVEDAVARVSDALSTRPIVSSTQIMDLNSDEYTVRYPIPVIIAERIEEITATFPEIETQGRGSTPAQAINDLKEQIVLLYEDLEAKEPEGVDDLSRGWWRVLGHYVAKGEMEQLPAAYKVDWMIDNVPGQYLPAMTKDLLGHVIRSRRSPDVHGFAELLSDWEATIEELIADGEELDQVLSAREEIRGGKGIPWDEAKTRLGV